jgi:hypothetical protein
MIPVVIAYGATAVIAKLVSDYLSDGIEDSYQKKRKAIKRRANKIIRDNEINSRDILLDMLTEAQEEAWEEIKIIRSNYPNIKKQLEFLIYHSQGNKDFKSRKYNVEYYTALQSYLQINKAREYYWHCLVHKYSKKKYELTTETLNKKKILRKKYFQLPDPDDFIKSIPVKGMVIDSLVERVSNKSISLSCKIPIQGNSEFKASVDPTHYPRSTSRWVEGNYYQTFVTSVDYKLRNYRVDIAKTNLIRRIRLEGIQNITINAKPEIVLKNGKIVGYKLEENRIKYFLPISLTKNINLTTKVKAKIIPEQFNPFNIIVKQ